MTAQSIDKFLDVTGLTLEQFDGREPICGSLDLSGLTSLPEGFAPTVGGWLDLRGLTSLPEGFAPTVGGGLDLRCGLTADTTSPPRVLMWHTALGGTFCLADGIFCQVLGTHVKDDVTIRKIKRIGNPDTSYLVEQDGVTSHGKTVRDAVIDLRFKTADRDRSQYESLTLGSVLNYDDAVLFYRTITGACALGTSLFLSERLAVVKEKYTVEEILNLTRGEYGAESVREFIASTGG